MWQIGKHGHYSGLYLSIHVNKIVSVNTGKLNCIKMRWENVQRRQKEHEK